jgi:hypothetical protein
VISIKKKLSKRLGANVDDDAGGEEGEKKVLVLNKGSGEREVTRMMRKW